MQQDLSTMAMHHFPPIINHLHFTLFTSALCTAASAACRSAESCRRAASASSPWMTALRLMSRRAVGGTLPSLLLLLLRVALLALSSSPLGAALLGCGAAAVRV